MGTGKAPPEALEPAATAAAVARIYVLQRGAELRLGEPALVLGVLQLVVAAQQPGVGLRVQRLHVDRRSRFLPLLGRGGTAPGTASARRRGATDPSRIALTSSSSTRRRRRPTARTWG